MPENCGSLPRALGALVGEARAKRQPGERATAGSDEGTPPAKCLEIQRNVSQPVDTSLSIDVPRRPHEKCVAKRAAYEGRPPHVSEKGISPIIEPGDLLPPRGYPKKTYSVNRTYPLFLPD